MPPRKRVCLHAGAAAGQQGSRTQGAQLSATEGSTDHGGCSVRTQHQCLLDLPQELLENIISHLDHRNLPSVYRACKQLRGLVATRAAARWSKRVQTRLLMNIGVFWGESSKYYPGEWRWLQHRHTPTYVMVEDKHDGLPALLQTANTDAGQVARLVKESWSELQLHIHPPRPDQAACVFAQAPASQPIYVQSWLTFFLNPQQASPAVAACFNHITIIRLQDVRLTHPLPECIRLACPALKRYVLQNVLWPEQVSAGNPWPQLQYLAYGSNINTRTASRNTAQLPRLINPTTLPGLQGLHINSWPVGVPANPAAACIVAFRSQLTTLQLGGDTALRNIVGGQGWPAEARTFPHLTHATLRAAVNSEQLKALLTSAVALRELQMHNLHSTHSLADMQCKLQQLSVYSTPQFVTAIAMLPRMPELRTLTLPSYDVSQQAVTVEQVAAAAAAVDHLPQIQCTLNLRFRGALPGCERHLRMLGPLLQALCRKSVKIELCAKTINGAVLRALGAAALPKCEFSSCTWDPPSILSRVWALMPHTIEVKMALYNAETPCVGVEEALMLCRSATRPVTVHLPLEDVRKQVCNTLAAEKNSLVTIKQV